MSVATQNTTVLIVDDEAVKRKVLAAKIKNEGYTILEAADGASALSLAAQADIVLLDVMMPGIDGIEVTRRLKEDERTCHIPIIALTALDDEEVRVRALHAGADDFMSKPPGRLELKVRLRNLIRLKHSHDALARHNLALSGEVAQQGVELKRSERFMRDSLDALTAQIAIVDHDGLIVEVNEPWRRSCRDNDGDTHSYYVGSSYAAPSMLRCDASARAAADGLARVLKSADSNFELEYPCHSSEKKRWFRMQITGFSDGGRRYAVVAHEDITKRRQAEQALSESEQTWRTLVQTAPDIISILRRDGTLLFINSDPNGDDPGDLFGKSTFEFMAPHQQTIVEAAMDRAMETGELQTYEIEICHADGQYCWYQTRLRYILGEEAAAEFLLFSTNLVEKRSAETALRESEANYRRLVETSVEGICVFDARGRVSFANTRMAEILGCSLDEFMKDGPIEFLGEDGPSFMERIIAATSNDGRGSWEFPIRRRDGSDRWLWLNTTLITSDDGFTGGLLGMFIDITDRKTTEAQLQESRAQLMQVQKMDAIGVLAGGVAHDFNNILTIIMSCATYLRSSFPVSDARREDVDAILSASEQAAGLTGQLLAFSRGEPLEERVLDLNDALVNLKSMLCRIIGEHVEISIETCEQPARMKISPNQLDQVILNLVVNARDACPQGGSITITCDRTELDGSEEVALKPGCYVRLRVADQGIGMDEETQRRIFEPFYTTKAQGEGTGLGLATCYGIVIRSAGQITVDSELGCGTTFSLFWPLSNQAIDPTLARKTGLMPAVGTEDVLLVEDDRAIRRLMCNALEDAGYDVTIARNGAEAVEELNRASKAPSLMVCDILLPKLGGYEVAIRALELYPSLPILLITGFTGDLGELRKELPDDVVTMRKPFAGPSLLRQIRETLDSPRRGFPERAARPCILLVDDDQSLRSAMTRVVGASYDVVEAGSYSQAQACIAENERISAIVCDLHLGDATGAELFEWLSEHHPALCKSIAFMTGGTQAGPVHEFAKEHADKVLCKPLPAAQLLRCVSELCLHSAR